MSDSRRPGPHRETNARWDFVATFPGYKSTGRCTAHGPEQVKVPAGTFDAIRVESEAGTASGDGSFVADPCPTCNGGQIESFSVHFTCTMADGTTGGGSVLLFQSEGSPT
jgi:DnaJ-class molecular chaperone